MITDSQTDSVGLYLVSVLFVLYLWNGVLTYIDAMFSNVTTATVFARRLREDKSLEGQDSKSSSVFPPRKRDPNLEAAFDKRKTAVRKAMDYLTERERDETGGEWDLARRKLEADRARQYLADKEYEKEQESLATEREVEKEMLYRKQQIENEKLEKEQAVAAKRERQRQQELELQKQREFLMHAHNYDDTGLLWPPKMPVKMRIPGGSTSREDSIEYYSSDDSDDEHKTKKSQSTSSPEEEPVIMGHLARAMMRAEERTAERLTSRPEGTRPWKSPETTAEIHHYGVRTLPIASTHRMLSPQDQSSDLPTSPEGPSGDELSSNDEGRKVKFGKKSNGQGIKSSKKTSSGSESSVSEGILKNNGKNDSPEGAHGGARPKTKLSGDNVDEQYKKKQAQNSRGHKLSPRPNHKEQPSPDFRSEKKTDKHFGFTLGQSDIERGYLHHMGLDVLAVDPDDTMWKEKIERHEKNLAAQKYQSTESRQLDRDHSLDTYTSVPSEEGNVKPEASPTSPRNIIEMPGNLDGQLEELTKRFRAERQKVNEKQSDLKEDPNSVNDDLTIVEEDEEEEKSLSRDSSFKRRHGLKLPKTTREGPILVPPSVMKEAIRSHGTIGVMSTRVGIPEEDAGKAEPGTVLLKHPDDLSGSGMERRSSTKSTSSRKHYVDYDRRGSSSRRPSDSGDLEKRGSTKSKESRSPSQPCDAKWRESDRNKSNLTREHSSSLKIRKEEQSHSSQRRKSDGEAVHHGESRQRIHSHNDSQGGLRSRRPGIPPELKSREKISSAVEISPRRLETDKSPHTTQKSPSTIRSAADIMKCIESKRERSPRPPKSPRSPKSPKSTKSGRERERANVKTSKETTLTPPTAPVRRNRSSSRQRKLEKTPELDETDGVPPKEGEMTRSPSIIRNSKKIYEQSQLAENDMNKSAGKEVKWAKEIERGREERRLEAPERPKRRRDDSRSVERGEVRRNSDRGRDTKRDSLIGTSKSDSNIKSLMKTEPIREGIMSEQSIALPKRPARRSRSRGASSEAQQRIPLPTEGNKDFKDVQYRGEETQRSPTKEEVSEDKMPSSPSAEAVPSSPSKEDLLKETIRAKEVQLSPERIESPRSPMKKDALDGKDESKSPKSKDRVNETEVPRCPRQEEKKEPEVDKSQRSPRSEDPLLSPETEEASPDSKSTWNIPTRPERKHRKSERKMKKSESTEERITEKSLAKDSDIKSKRTHSFESIELKITLDDDDKQDEEKENIPENRIPSPISSTKVAISPPPEDKHSDGKVSPSDAEVSPIKGTEDSSIRVSEKPPSNELPAGTSEKADQPAQDSIPPSELPMTLPVEQQEEPGNIPTISSPDTGPSSIEPDFPERPPRKTKMKKRKVLAEKHNLVVQTKVENLEQSASNLNTDQKISPKPKHDSRKPEYDSVKGSNLNTDQKMSLKSKHDSLKPEHDSVKGSNLNTDQKMSPQPKHDSLKPGSDSVKGPIQKGSTSPKLLSPVSPQRRARSPLSQIRSRSLDHSTSSPSTSKEKSIFARHRTNMKEISNIIEEITQKTVSMMRHPGFTSCAALKRELSADAKGKSKDPKKSPMIRQRRSRSQDRFCSSTPIEPEFVVEKRKSSTLTRKPKDKRDKSAPAALSAPSVVSAELSAEASEPAPEAKPRRKHAAKLAKLHIHIPKADDVPATESPEVFLKKPVAEIMMDIEKSPIFHTQIVHPTKISETLIPEPQVQEKDAPKTPVRCDSLPTYSPETIRVTQDPQEQVEVEAVLSPTSTKADVLTMPGVTVGRSPQTEYKYQRFTNVKPGTGIGRVTGPRHSPRPELPKCVVDASLPITSAAQVKGEPQTTVSVTHIKGNPQITSVTPVEVESQIASSLTQSQGELQVASSVLPVKVESQITTSVTPVLDELQAATSVIQVTDEPQATTSVTRVIDGPQVKTNAEIGSNSDDSVIDHGDSLKVSVGSPTFFPHTDPLRSPGGTKPPHKPPYTLWGEDGWVRTSPDRMEHHPHFPNHTPPVGDMWDSRRGSMKSDSTPETDRRSLVKRSDLRSESESEAKSESDLEKVLESDVESKEDLSSIPKPEIKREVENDNVTAESLEVPSGIGHEETKEPDESPGDTEKEYSLEDKRLSMDLNPDSSEIKASMEKASELLDESAVKPESDESNPTDLTSFELASEVANVSQYQAGSVRQVSTEATSRECELIQEDRTLERNNEDLTQREQTEGDKALSVRQESIEALLQHDNDQHKVQEKDSETEAVLESVHADTKEKAIECDLMPDTKDETTECDLSEPETMPTPAATVLGNQDETDSLDDDVFEPAQSESETGEDLVMDSKEEVQDIVQGEIEPLQPDHIDNNHVEKFKSHSPEKVEDDDNVTLLETQVPPTDDDGQCKDESQPDVCPTDADVKESHEDDGGEVKHVPSDQFVLQDIVPDSVSEVLEQIPADISPEESREVEVTEEIVPESDTCSQLQAAVPLEPTESLFEVDDGLTEGLAKDDTAVAHKEHGDYEDTIKTAMDEPIPGTTHNTVTDGEHITVCESIPGYVQDIFSVSEYIRNTALETISEQQEIELPSTVTEIIDSQTLQDSEGEVDGNEVFTVESDDETKGTESFLDAHSGIDLPSLEDVASAQHASSISVTEIAYEDATISGNTDGIETGDDIDTETAIENAEVASKIGTDIKSDKHVHVLESDTVTEFESAENVSGSEREKECTDPGDETIVECREKIETATLDSSIPSGVVDNTNDVEVTDDVADITEAVADVTDTVADVTDTVADISDVAADITDNIANVTDDVADVTDTVADVTGNVADVTDTVTDISDVVADVTNNVADVTDAVADVTDTAADVKNTVTDISDVAADVTDNVADVTEAVADVTDTVADVTGNVADVTDTVADISDVAADVTDAEEDVTECTVTDIADDVADAGIAADVSDNVVVDFTFNITDGGVPSISFDVACTTDDVPGVPDDVAAVSDEAVSDVADDVVDVGVISADITTDVVDNMIDNGIAVAPEHSPNIITDDVTVDVTSDDVGHVPDDVTVDVNKDIDKVSPDVNNEPITAGQDTETAVADVTDPVVAEGSSDDVKVAGDDVATGFTDGIVAETISDDVTKVSDDVTNITVSDDVTKLSDDVTEVSDDVTKVSDDVGEKLTEGESSTDVCMGEESTNKEHSQSDADASSDPINVAETEWE